MLQLAWNDCTSEADPLLTALEARRTLAIEIQDQDVSSASSNSHSATSNMPGENNYTDAEAVRAWTQIIEGFRVARQFLQDCADYGYDAFTIKCTQVFPSPLPTKLTTPVTVDSNSRWTRLARFNDIDPAAIVGVVVGDEATYCWLLDNPQMMNIEHGVTESRGDYSGGLVGRAGGLAYV